MTPSWFFLAGATTLALLMGIVTTIALTMQAGRAARPAPLPRLQGFDFLIAGLLVVVGAPLLLDALATWQGFDLPPNAAHPIRLLLLAASLLPAYAWLRIRGGCVVGHPKPGEEGDYRPGDGPRSASWALKCYLATLPALLALSLVNFLVLGLLEQEPLQELIVGFQSLGPGLWPFSFLLAVLVVPICEDVLFRCYLFRWLAGRPEYGPRRAVLFSAIVFGLCHPPQASMPMIFFGALLGWVRWRSGRLRWAVLLHVLHNALVALATAFLAALSASS